MVNTQDNYLPSIEVNPTSQVKKCVIWLHGLGANGSDFVPMVPELKLPESLGVRFVFPHAPVIPVTVNNGYEMPAWFDLYGFDAMPKIDTAGIAKSQAAIGKLIEREVELGVATKDIMLAGFSQGAALALLTGLTYPKPLAGILALSGMLPDPADILRKRSEANSEIPIFIAHGTEDPVLPYALGKATYMALKPVNPNVEWHSYPMAHSVCQEEVQDLSFWMQKVFK